MPIRDWVCEKCREVMSDVPDKANGVYCPKCGHKMKKMACSPHLKFNGSGWTQRFYK